MRIFKRPAPAPLFSGGSRGETTRVYVCDQQTARHESLPVDSWVSGSCAGRSGTPRGRSIRVGTGGFWPMRTLQGVRPRSTLVSSQFCQRASLITSHVLQNASDTCCHQNNELALQRGYCGNPIKTGLSRDSMYSMPASRMSTNIKSGARRGRDCSRVSAALGIGRGHCPSDRVVCSPTLCGWEGSTGGR